MAYMLMPKIRRHLAGCKNKMILEMGKNLHREEIITDGSLEKRCLGDKVLHKITKHIKFNETYYL